MTFDERIRKIIEVQRGWLGYFRMAKISGKLKSIDGWLRIKRSESRIPIKINNNMSKPPEVLHMVPQLREKKPERKRKNLVRLGVNQGQAYAWSRTRMGGWAVAQSPILGTTITLERLRKRGYVSLLEMYEKIAPHLNEPLYTRPAWFILSLSKDTVV